MFDIYLSYSFIQFIIYNIYVKSNFTNAALFSNLCKVTFPKHLPSLRFWALGLFPLRRGAPTKDSRWRQWHGGQRSLLRSILLRRPVKQRKGWCVFFGVFFSVFWYFFVVVSLLYVVCFFLRVFRCLFVILMFLVGGFMRAKDVQRSVVPCLECFKVFDWS